MTSFGRSRGSQRQEDVANQSQLFSGEYFAVSCNLCHFIYSVPTSRVLSWQCNEKVLAGSDWVGEKTAVNLYAEYQKLNGHSSSPSVYSFSIGNIDTNREYLPWFVGKWISILIPLLFSFSAAALLQLHSIHDFLCSVFSANSQCNRIEWISRLTKKHHLPQYSHSHGAEAAVASLMPIPEKMYHLYR